MKTKDKSRSRQSTSAGSKQSGSQGSRSGDSPSMQEPLQASQPSHKIDKRSRKQRG
jgi:hypothetical protein